MRDPPLPTNQRVMAIHPIRGEPGSPMLPPVRLHQALEEMFPRLLRLPPRVARQQLDLSRYDPPPYAGSIPARDPTSKAVPLD